MPFTYEYVSMILNWQPVKGQRSPFSQTKVKKTMHYSINILSVYLWKVDWQPSSPPPPSPLPRPKPFEDRWFERPCMHHSGTCPTSCMRCAPLFSSPILAGRQYAQKVPPSAWSKFSELSHHTGGVSSTPPPPPTHHTPSCEVCGKPKKI